MNDLKVLADEMLPVYETSTGTTVVNARELHEKMMIGKDFTNWIKDRIDRYGFSEGEDFTPILAKSDGGRPRTEYLLSLDTAKEIAMVENNEMGRAIRKYFIEVEKRFRQQQPKSQLEVLQIAVNQIVEMDKKLHAIESSVETLSYGLTAVPDAAKVVERVNEYARYTRMGHDEIYNSIYQILKAQHGIDVKARVENERRKINADYYARTGKLYAESTLKKKVNGVDVMVRMGALDKFNSILVGLLAKAKGIPTA